MRMVVEMDLERANYLFADGRVEAILFREDRWWTALSFRKLSMRYKTLGLLFVGAINGAISSRGG